MGAAGYGTEIGGPRSHPNPGAKASSAAHSSSRWGFLHPDGAVASPRFGGMYLCCGMPCYFRCRADVRMCELFGDAATSGSLKMMCYAHTLAPF
jgi:hypothetical protein